MIDQFLSKVVWGQLDALVIDTPPGTSDEHISVVEKIREYSSSALRGAIIVSTPQVSVFGFFINLAPYHLFFVCIQISLLSVFVNLTSYFF